MAPVLGPPIQNIKGGGQKQGPKNVPVFGVENPVQCSLFLELMFKKKWVIFRPILKQKLAHLLLKTDIHQYAELIRLLMLMTKIRVNL